MLPSDAKERKAADHVTILQTQVNKHFSKAQPEDKPLPYTDNLFKEAAIEWLIQTDQVSFCFENTNIVVRYPFSFSPSKHLNICPSRI
jgi:hypothetical protein